MSECKKPNLKIADDAATRLYSPAPRRARVTRVLWRRLVSWLEWRASVMELQQLRDRDLRDIGLYRHEIPTAVDYLLGRRDRPEWYRD
jgi:uncharacterized protein YjiS (DUF1127 family)